MIKLKYRHFTLKIKHNMSARIIIINQNQSTREKNISQEMLSVE